MNFIKEFHVKSIKIHNTPTKIPRDAQVSLKGVHGFLLENCSGPMNGLNLAPKNAIFPNGA
jgi:hypothetical protein